MVLERYKIQTLQFSVCKQCHLALLRQFHSSRLNARSAGNRRKHAKEMHPLTVKSTFEDRGTRTTDDRPPARWPPASSSAYNRSSVEWSSPSRSAHDRLSSFRRHTPISMQQSQMPTRRPWSMPTRRSSPVKAIKQPSPEDIRIMLRQDLPKWLDGFRGIPWLMALGIEEKEARAILAAFKDHMINQLLTPLESEDPREPDPWGILHLWTGEAADRQAVVARVLTMRLLNFASQPALEIEGVDPESLYTLQQANEAMDLRFPAEAFPSARSRTRKVYLHVGPTNSGKTYNALRALASARSGVYAGPLRLLAHEVWERLNRGSIRPFDADPSTAHLYARDCNLVTGEEQRIVSMEASLTSCTVEMVNLFKHWSICVIDEIQMIADPQRGASWTAAVLGVCADELHLCGEEAAVPLIQALMKETGDELVIKHYKRLTPLAVADKSLEGNWELIQKGDCIVTFSRDAIFHLKDVVERATGMRCAVAYGRLPPETRSEQAALFNDPTSGYDVIVATDAIGMGLNLKIKRVVFVQLTKYNGSREVPLSVSQIKQIGGRAGRFGTQGDASSTGIVTCLNPNDLPLLVKAFEAPPVTLHKAVVPFHLSMFNRIAQLLPDTFGLKDLVSLLSMAARIGPNYTLSNDMGSWAGMEFIDHHCKDLRLVEKMTFATCPTTWRSETEVFVFGNYLRAFADGGAVVLRDCLQGTSLLTTLRDVTDSRNAHRQHHPASQIARGYAIQNTTTLATLETLHKVLITYIWLSFRMSASFPEQTEAVHLKEEVEAGIEFILEGLGDRKLKRLRMGKTMTQLRKENMQDKIEYKPRVPRIALPERRARERHAIA